MNPNPKLRYAARRALLKGARKMAEHTTSYGVVLPFTPGGDAAFTYLTEELFWKGEPLAHDRVLFMLFLAESLR